MIRRPAQTVGAASLGIGSTTCQMQTSRGPPDVSDTFTQCAGGRSARESHRSLLMPLINLSFTLCSSTRRIHFAWIHGTSFQPASGTLVGRAAVE
jgi:hypothetical protein